MKVHITVADDGGPPGTAAVTTPATGPEATDAGAAPGATAGEPAAGAAGQGTDGGAAPGWLTDLVRLADAGRVPRPDAPAGPGQEAGSQDAGAAPVSG
ncbi:hypothetical protein AB8O64_03695 [Streptomyces sp. QH1-20]|uniref:hypothetical protein n=1 Tax=Streptomyces sp. QH1-20 TaxID=3240934 RepID=UPI003512E3F6